MGKDNLLVGTARGKLGDVVFYRTGGEQRFRSRVKPMNPRSNAQVIQRIVVSTVVKAYSMLENICNHAFQGYTGKLKNHQRFMRLNIDQMRKVALDNVKTWSPIQFKLVHEGNWSVLDAARPSINELIVSEGDMPTTFFYFNEFDYFNTSDFVPMLETSKINNSDYYIPVGNATYAEMAKMLGVNIGDQLTFILQTGNEKDYTVERTYVTRIILMPSNGNVDERFWDTNQNDNDMKKNGRKINLPNKENYGDLKFFTNSSETEEGLIAVVPENDTNIISKIAAFGVITSRYENGMWRRSTSKLIVQEKFADKALLSIAADSYMKAKNSSQYLNQANQ